MKPSLLALPLALMLALVQTPPAGAEAENDALAAVLVDGEEWQVVAEGLGFADGPSCDADGNFYFSDLKGKPPAVYKVTPDGKRSTVVEAGRSGTKFGADGRLYACGGGKVVAYDLAAGAKESVLAEGLQPNDLAVTHKGYVYITETGKKQVTFLDPKTGEKRAADVGINKPNGITLSPDQKTLLVSDYGGVNVWTFAIGADGKLTDKKPAMTMKAPANKPDNAGGDGMTTDTAGRYYVTTALGVQVFSPAGELLGVLPKPKEGPLTSCGFAGKDLAYLYVTCGDKVYRRMTKATGVLFFRPPAEK
jgi:sugar lactone lactonase YvrE